MFLKPVCRACQRATKAHSLQKHVTLFLPLQNFYQTESALFFLVCLIRSPHAVWSLVIGEDAHSEDGHGDDENGLAEDSVGCYWVG